jgi:DNA-binding NarL/FixJ family response regulator
MGKTTFADHVRDEARAREFTVLETRGVEADAELGFASLLTLLRPIDDELDELAGPRAADLHTALTLGSRATTDDGRVRVALYRVVTRLADRGPVLLLVDDAQHLDAATATVLAFVLGRLTSEAVASILTVDGELPAPLDDLALPTVELPRLGRAEIEAIVRADGEIADAALDACCDFADGNPLIALELARSLTDDERAGRAPVALLPKPPLALARRFAMRLEAFDPVASRALAVVAADDTGRTAVVRDALARLGEPAEALDLAEQTGAIVADGPSVRFAHPLLRAVAYHSIPASSRRAAHRALAASLDAPTDAAARAWQLAAAADGEDENAAEALLLVAGDLTRRGGGSSAARVYERAAALTPAGPERSRRSLLAAEAWLDAFEPAAAGHALAGIAIDDGDLLAGVATVERWAHGPASTLDRVRTSDADAPIAGALEADLVLDAEGEAEAVPAASPVADDEFAPEAARNLATIVLARAGSTVLCDKAPAPTGMARLDALTGVRFALGAAEHGDHADVADRPYVESTVVAATAARHAGDVVGAYDRLTFALGVVPERATLPRAVLDVALADVEQLLGRDADARARVERSDAVLRAHGARGLAAGAQWVLGRLALGAGDTAGATHALDQATRARPHLFGADLAVVLAADRPTEADRIVSSLRADADPASIPGVRAARARGAVRSDDAMLQRAAEAADGAGFPVEAAETRLAQAEVLARAGRRDECRTLARAVADSLARRGVRGWDARIARLVDGEGTGTVDDVTSQLTAAEYRVALAVADGATNREAAAALFLSVKTVDFHLQNIYRKLGLRSRTELAVRMRHGPAATAPAGTGSGER